MLKLFKKTLAVCLIGFGLRSIACYITSIFRLVVYYWCYSSSSRNCMDFVLKDCYCISFNKLPMERLKIKESVV